MKYDIKKFINVTKMLDHNTGSKHPISKVKNIQEEMNQLCLWIKSKRNNYHPVEFAALLHKKFVFILPFKKGNGQIVRLLINTVLIQDGYLPALILPHLRKKYITLLEQAHKNDHDFIEFIVEREIESQKCLLRLLQVTLIENT